MECIALHANVQLIKDNAEMEAEFMKAEEIEMALKEVRKTIDEIDTQMKPLFLQRMECGKHVAEAKAQTGGDVFVLERECEIIEKRSGDVKPEIQEEYRTFLRHLMSICRKYEYELLPQMQEKVITAALKAAGVTAETEHSQVKIAFTCPKETSNLNLFLNMTKLNGITVDALNLTTEDGVQKITMILDGKVTEASMRCLLCQIGKEADDFQIVELVNHTRKVGI